MPQRYVFALMGFLVNVVVFALRVCLSVAIIEMVVPFNNIDTATESLVCPVDALTVTDDDQERIVRKFLFNKINITGSRTGFLKLVIAF